MMYAPANNSCNFLAIHHLRVQLILGAIYQEVNNINNASLKKKLNSHCMHVCMHELIFSYGFEDSTCRLSFTFIKSTA